MPALLKNAPFIRYDLISGTERWIDGVELLYKYVNLRDYEVVEVARSVVNDYSDWDWDQSFGMSDMTYAIQLYIDRVIETYKLPLKTEFSPNLKIVEL